MTYLEILEVFAAAARTVDPDATYFRGRLSDISLASVKELIQVGDNKNLIYCEDLQTVTPQSDVNTTEQWRFRLGFFRQDSSSSESMEENQQQVDEESREIIFSLTLILARKYLDALYNEDQFQITGTPQLTQVTRIFQGCLTGWGCDINVILDVGCDYQTEINDAIYKNSDNTFTVSIKRGEVYPAPDITVTDSDGSQYEHPANKPVICTPSASPAEAVLKNSAGTVISTTPIDPGTSEDIPAPDATNVLKNTNGDVIETVVIPSDVSDDTIITDVSWTDSDGSAESTPYGDAIVCIAQIKNETLVLVPGVDNDTSLLVTNNSGTTWTFTGITDDGGSGTITVSDNGAAYGAFVNPTTIANGETIQVKRTITTGAGLITLTGTHS